MFSFLKELSDANKLAGQRFHVIFYAENGYYFQYYCHLFNALVQVPGIRIAYITSDRKDALLEEKRVHAVYLKQTLAGIFPRLRADVMIMTMPDLQKFIYKRSPEVKRYVYVFHALVSTHQQYRSGAFDHYDTIFCTGPQQEKELKESEKLYGLPAKEHVHYGYPLLRLLKEKSGESIVRENKILIAPSWYTEGILNTCILPLVNQLRKSDWEVWIRPHPEFIKRNAAVYKQLVKQTMNGKNVRFDLSPSVYTHLADAAHLITDRSGIGLEYALATYRPVLFIDTPLKIQNPDVRKFSMEPLENMYRNKLGDAVDPAGLQLVNDMLQKQKRSAETWRTSIKKVEENIVFPEECWQNGVAYILKHLSL